MSAFVLDCSVAMGWYFEEEFDLYARRVMRAVAADPCLVPAIWPLEIANVLLVAERRKRTDAAGSARFLGLLSELPISVAPSPAVAGLARLADLARRHGLTAYDAAYLALALEAGLPLATRDADLRRAARGTGVRLYGG